jgi:hypothetical protein
MLFPDDIKIKSLLFVDGDGGLTYLGHYANYDNQLLGFHW